MLSAFRKAMKSQFQQANVGSVPRYSLTVTTPETIVNLAVGLLELLLSIRRVGLGGGCRGLHMNGGTLQSSSIVTNLLPRSSGRTADTIDDP